MNLMFCEKYAHKKYGTKISWKFVILTLEFSFNLLLKSFFFPNESKSGNSDEMVPNQKSLSSMEWHNGMG